jgi:hypothetical protein
MRAKPISTADLPHDKPSLVAPNIVVTKHVNRKKRAVNDRNVAGLYLIYKKKKIEREDGGR